MTKRPGRMEIREARIAKRRLAELFGSDKVQTEATLTHPFSVLVDSIGKRLQDRTNELAAVKAAISPLRADLPKMAEDLTSPVQEVNAEALSAPQVIELFGQFAGKAWALVNFNRKTLADTLREMEGVKQEREAFRRSREDAFATLDRERAKHVETKKNLAMALRQLSTAKADFHGASNAALYWSREAKGAMAVVAHDSVFNPRPKGYEGIESAAAPAAFVTDLWEWDGSTWKLRVQPMRVDHVVTKPDAK